ncbi:UNVERIFIED_CONTAM: hypothetical protein GTU68_042658 [Idotea baltica]|nr:hypothetical protein [Idotea baltica]
MLRIPCRSKQTATPSW